MISEKEFHSRVDNFWPKTDLIEVYGKEETQFYRQKIKRLLREKSACLISHYYVDSDIQALAEETGGMIGDSLAMAKFGHNNSSKTLVVAGVRFMGESAKILSPEKKVLMPTLDAECSLDLSCQEDEFKDFIAQHPDRTMVVYVNTSARIKALSDWTVTSSSALEICEYLDKRGEKILWGPDKYLGRWIEGKTGADMVHYNGSCIVHEEFKAKAIYDLKVSYPGSSILVHPESPPDVISLADVTGSTSQLLEASQKLPAKVFIVATESGIFYKMKQASPNKIFIKAPTMGKGTSCKACSQCPWMKMNSLKNLAEVLETEKNEIIVPDEVRKSAFISLQRMINFKNTCGLRAG
jgi:quinolinate synthase